MVIPEVGIGLAFLIQSACFNPIWVPLAKLYNSKPIQSGCRPLSNINSFFSLDHGSLDNYCIELYIDILE